MDDDHQQPLALILARNLVTHLRVPAFVTDATGRLVFANEAASAVSGDGPLAVAAAALRAQAPTSARVGDAEVSAIPIVSAEGTEGAIAFLQI